MNNIYISKFIKFIALVLLLIFPLTANAVEKVSVTSRTPITMSLKKQQSLSIQGTTIHKAKSVSVGSSTKQTFKEFATNLSCKAPAKKGAKSNCIVRLTLNKAVPLGQYILTIRDARRKTLAVGRFEVKADAAAIAKAATRNKQPTGARNKVAKTAKLNGKNSKKQSLSTGKQESAAKALAIRPTRKQQTLIRQKAALDAKQKSDNEKRNARVTKQNADRTKVAVGRKQQSVARQKTGASDRQIPSTTKKGDVTKTLTARNKQAGAKQTFDSRKQQQLVDKRTNDLVAKRKADDKRKKAERANSSTKTAHSTAGEIKTFDRQARKNTPQTGAPVTTAKKTREDQQKPGKARLESPRGELAETSAVGGGPANNEGLPELAEVSGVDDSGGNIELQLPGFTSSSHTIEACESFSVPIVPVGGTAPYQVTATGAGSWVEAVQKESGFEVVFPGAAVGNDYPFEIEVRDAAGGVIRGETVIQVRGSPPPIELTNVSVSMNSGRAINHSLRYKIGGEYVSASSNPPNLSYSCGTSVAPMFGVYQNPELIGTYADGSRYSFGVISATGTSLTGLDGRIGTIPVLDRGRNVSLSIAYDNGESNQVMINLTPATYTYEGVKGKGPQAEIADALFNNDPLEPGLFGVYEMKPEDFMISESDDLTGDTGCLKTLVRFKDVQVSGVFGTSQVNEKPADLSILKAGNMPKIGWVTEGAQVRFRVYLSGELFAGPCTYNVR